MMLNNRWDEILRCEFEAEYFKKLSDFVDKERNTEGKIIYPPENDVYTALKLTPPEQVKAVILGQDPYINPGEAHGLAFSVKSSKSGSPTGSSNVKFPPSLRNIFKEITADIGGTFQTDRTDGEFDGNLERWAKQGVLLLNTVLTVEAGKSNSHAKKGWEKFTDSVIKYIGRRENPAVFILWGKNAQSKENLINQSRHLILKSAHPSPLSANAGFFGCRHFSQANRFLEEQGIAAIDWR
jgi:uracil-DNA glycosylase